MTSCSALRFFDVGIGFKEGGQKPVNGYWIPAFAYKLEFPLSRTTLDSRFRGNGGKGSVGLGFSVLPSAGCFFGGAGGLFGFAGAEHGFGGDVKGGDAFADFAFFFVFFDDGLQNGHVDGDVEFVAGGHQGFDVFLGDDAVDGGAHAGAAEFVFEVFAHHGVVAAAAFKNVHAAGDFAVGEQGGACHGVVPILVEPAKGHHAFKFAVFAEGLFAEGDA